MSTSDVGKKKQDPLGGTYVSPRDVGKKKKTRPARGDLCLTSDVGKKTRPARGDVCLTSDVGKKKNKTR